MVSNSKANGETSDKMMCSVSLSSSRNAANERHNHSSFSFLSYVKYEHLIAGVSGGVVSTLVLHPLDLLKIRLAVNDGQVVTRPRYHGLTNALTTIFRDEGIRGLYRGVTPNCWGAGAAWGFYFLFYNTIKAYMLEDTNTVHLGPDKHMLAAAEAGVLTLVMTNPIWVVKTRLCLQYGNEQLYLPSSKRYSGMRDAFKKVYKHEGITGFYKGFVPGIIGVSHGAFQFMAYEELKKIYLKKYNLSPDVKLGTFEYLSFAALSKLFAASITYPYQVVRARLQDQHNEYKGLIDVIRKTWRLEGIKGFYKGIVPNLLRVVPATALTFIVYENMQHFLRDLREGKKTLSS
ncbi:mitochondrial folate transporter/carrier-like protein [Dinothrombium tinctorium]|uniref:Solute carrier family 25 member 32 n=1 Tax=Dinothrombium tinctorium TaxID=1965070 RepID=A0A3S3Q0Z1_9ACAR|nr:mitochondrial folate transporter/carrier-like protein [Dinothrombium tinctorium]RWS11852.1 mitochondrial folate transporter/carrier-like protein [Dinothrombium tinctorium]RWS12128.1 mitochondrial folate transporter/carrier-like protein [Dinothrombium tinctorium]RWS12358.1 mitochondrial folate transporter/carrier-like protein [Dinothrombium tinctorium]